ncbi:MAG: septum formation initiator family protein [Bryobacteraceae bacterium]|nr:septum formation initiator family protein [Bryobacteraceae bacterium]
MKQLLRKSGVIVGALVLCAYGIAALRGPNGLNALSEKRHQIQMLQEQNASLKADNDRKRERIELLRNDRATQDLEIRQRLKLVKPGETQFIVPDGGAAATTEPAKPPSPPAPVK